MLSRTSLIKHSGLQNTNRFPHVADGQVYPRKRSCKTLQVMDQNEGYFEDGRGSDSRVLRASNDYLTLLGKCHHMPECVVYSALVSSTEGL